MTKFKLDLATKEAPQSESTDLFEPYKQEITRLQRQIKGFKGREAQLLKKQARPEINEANPSPDNLGLSEIKPPQAEKPEYVRPYEKFCPDCGGENPNYVKPNLFCKDCGMPEGHIDKPEEADKIKMCWNCGSTKGVLKNGSD